MPQSSEHVRVPLHDHLFGGARCPHENCRYAKAHAGERSCCDEMMHAIEVDWSCYNFGHGGGHVGFLTACAVCGKTHEGDMLSDWKPEQMQAAKDFTLGKGFPTGNPDVTSPQGDSHMASRFDNVDLGNPMEKILAREKARLAAQNALIAERLGERFSLDEKEVLAVLEELCEESTKG